VAKIGLFGIGLDAYWDQYQGLLDRLTGYQSQIVKKMQGLGAEVIDCGLVDSVDKARQTADRLKKEDVSIIFLYVSTYALSSTVLPVVQTTKVPVVVLNLQPTAAIDYQWFNSLGDRTKMTGEWLANCQACSVPEIANAFRRAKVDFYQITGILDNDPIAWNQINDWILAAQTAESMRKNNVGLLGHYYNGMLDIYTDLTRQIATFGCAIQHIEMSQLLKLHEAVSEEAISRKVDIIHSHFDIQEDCSTSEIRRAAQTAVALDQLVEIYDLGAMAYFSSGDGDPRQEQLIASVIVGNSLLTSQGIPVAGEYEVKNVQAMKIMDLLGAGGSFSEFYAIDFNDDVVLLGHDGPGHTKIAEGKTKLRPLNVFHGKVGQGLSVEMSVQHGPATLLSVIDSSESDLELLVAEGESVPGPILEIGNTNSRYRFPPGARNFIDAWSQHGPAHHCAIGVGHIADRIEKIGHCFGIKTIRVC
jgi:L-arabinose isomerase